MKAEIHLTKVSAVRTNSATYHVSLVLQRISTPNLTIHLDRGEATTLFKELAAIIKVKNPLEYSRIVEKL